MKSLSFAAAPLLGLAALAAVGVNLASQKAALPNPKDVHDPANAVANLDVHPDLRATLFVSEPKITNPTNLDIDHRGRVWICDVKNYRGNNGKRPEGDRILILEDTDGDGVADTVKTFYQGRDVDSAMGICVLGNRVIVSCSPNVLVFTFDENDKVLKKEVLFTKTGIPQHDHSAHTFLFGPDGKLYWNFGNTGHAVFDKDGKPVVDLAGNVVNDQGKPYRQGMVFRCDPDGSNFEVLGHNFRNNYEVTVDSFGTLWQSDNDDDGNRGVRINYVMEFGNFGYVDEITGAGWQTKRTNLEKEIPERHWHLNDPGVVPNLLQTGGGSPAGICLYEGTLLPKVFHSQIIHCDPGPSVVRAYPVTPDGAGYKASIVNILDGSKRNNWFRPADVCVAPDGSLFVTDWYDPGVGGHGQRDLDRGRIFRVAPPGVKYTVPRVDLSTLDGCAEAMKSPNLATRYIAWTRLHEVGTKAEPVLLKLWEQEQTKANAPTAAERAKSDTRLRARLLWLLGKIESKGAHYVDVALKADGPDGNPDLRIVALRLARQLKLDVVPIIKRPEVLADPHGGLVQREAAITLRHCKSPGAAQVWAELALRSSPERDRWALEALGIGADKQWDAFLDAYLQEMGSKTIANPASRAVIWRSRATRTPELLAQIIRDPGVKGDEVPRFLRAFDFQLPGEQKNNALLQLACAKLPADRQAFVVTESLARLQGFDLKAYPQLAGPLNGALDSIRGTTQFVELVGRFGLTERYPELLALAQKGPTEQAGVDAMRMLLDKGQGELVRKALAGDKEPAIATAQALGAAAHEGANPLLLPIMQDSQQDLELRRQVTRALAKNKNGALALLRLTQEKKLDEGLVAAAGSALSTATWKDVQKQAAKLFPAPAGKDNQPLPAIPELAKLRGDAVRGKAVFANAGTCAKCHVVNGEGKEVGPNLSEIGKKLSREALYESILYPSASISHNYETYVLETKDGDVMNGVLVSKTAAEVTLKGADALVRSFKAAQVESLTRSPVSLMPADLHKALSTQDLADLVEYLQTLREARKAGP
jgi:putative membrane-bound dehydrogenase-like protein